MTVTVNQKVTNPYLPSGGAAGTTGTGNLVFSESPTITGNASLGSATVDIPSPTVNIGQGVAGVGQTVNIAAGGESGIVNIGHSDAPNSPSTTNILGNVNLGTEATETVVFNSPANFYVGATIVSGAINLYGGATNNSSYSTNNTTGSITIGGEGATGAITLGRSTATQTVNIATGVNNLVTKTLNLGTGATNGATIITLVPTGTVTGATTINIGTQARTIGATTVNIGTNATGGNANINIGSSIGGSNTTIRSGNLITSSTTLSTFNGSITVNAPIIQQTRTVSALPTVGGGAVVGMRLFVTDALSPTFGATVVGGGAVPVPVYYDGTSWKVG